MVTGILAPALLRWMEADPQQTFLVTVTFLVALFATLASAWHTHVRGRAAGENFLYAHVILDVLLVTAIVHATGGQESNFSPLYVLVISEGALLLPLSGGMLIAALACIVYFADLFWFHAGSFSGTVAYQIVLFAGVALVTGALGDRVRRAGKALGAVESELRQLRLDTGDILASISTGVLTVDGTGRLAYLNPAGEGLLGLDARQWMGAPVIEKVDEVAPGMGGQLLRSLNDGEPVVRFRTTARRAGREIVLGVSTTVLARDDGEPPSATALFQDISELERVEALNRRAERLAAVAELSASLAHEIKNPLASIRSAVEQITKPTLEAADRLLLQRLVVSESERLSRLLSEFLEFSAIAVGTRETLDLVQVARDCVALVRQHPECPESVEIELRLSDAPLDAPLYVHGDRDLLHRAVFNLVLNAVQFSGDIGKVRVHVTERGRAGAARVRLIVRDSGPGIAAEDVPRIFDPFYTRRRGGSGLGLAVVHRAVVAHEGTVRVESAPGGGAQFVVDLPGAPAPAPAPTRRREEQGTERGEKTKDEKREKREKSEKNEKKAKKATKATKEEIQA